LPITQQQILDIVQREFGNAETMIIFDLKDYQIIALRNGEQLLVRKNDGWGYVSKPDEHGVLRTSYDFGPSAVPKLLPG
jgi:hypothetical protein